MDGFLVGIHAQGILLTIASRSVERDDLLMPGKQAPRFDDEIRDVPSRRIDERANELSENGIGRADHDRGAIESILGGPKLLRLDKAEVIVHRVHGVRNSKLHASLNRLFPVRFVDWQTPALTYSPVEMCNPLPFEPVSRHISFGRGRGAGDVECRKFDTA